MQGNELIEQQTGDAENKIMDLQTSIAGKRAHMNIER